MVLQHTKRRIVSSDPGQQRSPRGNLVLTLLQMKWFLTLKLTGKSHSQLKETNGKVRAVLWNVYDCCALDQILTTIEIHAVCMKLTTTKRLSSANADRHYLLVPFYTCTMQDQTVYSPFLDLRKKNQCSKPSKDVIRLYLTYV